MISFDEAFVLIASKVTPLGTETVTIADAAGRILARSLHARSAEFAQQFAKRGVLSADQGHVGNAEVLQPDDKSRR